MPNFFPPAAATRRLHTATLAALLALTLAGCASVPPPDDSMNMAQAQLQDARDAGAADYAPVDLGFAQDKFQQAQTAMANGKYADAANLSEESRADAELARVKARLAAARAQIKKDVDENGRLRAQGEQITMPADTTAGPAAAPTPGEMPAPDASTLSAPGDSGFQTMPTGSQPSGQGFQNMPEQSAPAAATSTGTSEGGPR